jgi:hypothetical protein
MEAVISYAPRRRRRERLNGFSREIGPRVVLAAGENNPKVKTVFT